MQKTRTEVSGTDLLCFHFLMTSLMMNTQAMIDSVPPTLGMIARETSKDVKPPLIAWVLWRASPDESTKVDEVQKNVVPLKYSTFGVKM
jgi:hypothetical protein